MIGAVPLLFRERELNEKADLLDGAGDRANDKTLAAQFKVKAQMLRDKAHIIRFTTLITNQGGINEPRD